MSNRSINELFMSLSRRAERVDTEKFVNTFVNTGPLLQLLSSSDHQIIYGRRSTGKIHAPRYLADDRLHRGDISLYVDMRTIGSNGSIYNDAGLPVGERASRLLIDTASAVRDLY
jgi:hypothetical protein